MSRRWNRAWMRGDDMVAELALWAGPALRFGARLDLAPADGARFPAERRLSVSLAMVEVNLWWQARRYRAGGG